MEILAYYCVTVRFWKAMLTGDTKQQTVTKTGYMHLD